MQTAEGPLYSATFFIQHFLQGTLFSRKYPCLPNEKFFGLTHLQCFHLGFKRSLKTLALRPHSPPLLPPPLIFPITFHGEPWIFPGTIQYIFPVLFIFIKFTTGQMFSDSIAPFFATEFKNDLSEKLYQA